MSITACGLVPEDKDQKFARIDGVTCQLLEEIIAACANTIQDIQARFCLDGTNDTGVEMHWLLTQYRIIIKSQFWRWLRGTALKAMLIWSKDIPSLCFIDFISLFEPVDRSSELLLCCSSPSMRSNRYCTYVLMLVVMRSICGTGEWNPSVRQRLVFDKLICSAWMVYYVGNTALRRRPAFGCWTFLCLLNLNPGQDIHVIWIQSSQKRHRSRAQQSPIPSHWPGNWSFDSPSAAECG